MKTRREFFKLFGKAALVGGVVAAVPSVVLGLSAPKQVKWAGKEVSSYDLYDGPNLVTSGYMKVQDDPEFWDDYYVTGTTTVTSYDNEWVKVGGEWTNDTVKILNSAFDLP